MLFYEPVKEKRSPDADFLDVDIYNDLSHIPIGLKRSMTRDIRLMHGYCEVFGGIVSCLKERRLPTSQTVDQYIRYSCGKNDDAKLFLEAGGSSQYALRYLLDKLVQISLNHLPQIEKGLVFLPGCYNDIKYYMLKERLLIIN